MVTSTTPPENCLKLLLVLQKEFWSKKDWKGLTQLILKLTSASTGVGVEARAELGNRNDGTKNFVILIGIVKYCSMPANITQNIH